MQRLEASFSQQRRFVSDAAHELKTAVAVVKSSLQLLTMRQRTTDEYEAGVEVSLADCERMEEIVARMLTLARAEHPTTAEHAAGDCRISRSPLAASAQQFQSMAELRSVTIALAASEPVFVGLADRGMFTPVLQPAAERTAAQPNRLEVKVLLQCGRRNGGAAHRGLRAMASNPRCCRMSSSASRAAIPHAAGIPGGTGLGLAICKAIVDKAGGTIALTANSARAPLR